MIYELRCLNYYIPYDRIGWGEREKVSNLDHSTSSKQMTFTDKMRGMFKGVIEPIAAFLNHIGLHPNTVTILGLFGNAAGAVLVALGHISIGGIIVLIFAPLDILDGTMARLRGEVTNLGGFVDSVSDRYSELMLLGGLVYYFLSQNNALATMATYVAACAAVLVSYVKARAESLGYEAKIGFLSRLERYIVLIPCLILNIPAVAVWVLATFGNFTALQRIYSVRKQARKTTKEKAKGKRL
jgi:CDP-diacylglycerol--glycerol-3-phosphate 3-phosphatidyltransferase